MKVRVVVGRERGEGGRTDWGLVVCVGAAVFALADLVVRVGVSQRGVVSHVVNRGGSGREVGNAPRHRP